MKEFIVSYSVKDGSSQDYMRISEALKAICQMLAKHDEHSAVKIMDNLYLVSIGVPCSSAFILETLSTWCDDRFEFVVGDVSGTLRGSKSVIERFKKTFGR